MRGRPAGPCLIDHKRLRNPCPSVSSVVKNSSPQRESQIPRKLNSGQDGHFGQSVPMASSATSSAVRSQAASAVRALPAVSASDLKNRFGEISAQAAQGAISITRHQRPEFVLLPVAQYEALQQAHTA